MLRQPSGFWGLFATDMFVRAAYQMANADQRAMVLLHILSQPVPVKIDAASLRKVS